MPALVFDVETVPLAAALAEPYPRAERSAPANYKDPAKIEEWYARDEAQWRANRAKQCALDPLAGRVVALGWTLAGDGDGSIVTAPNESDERALLEQFWTLARLADGELVTWNGLHFDVPFVVTRSLLVGVRPLVPPGTVSAWTKRYAISPHFDCRARLTNWDPTARGTLREWATAFGIATEPTTGADVHAQYLAGDLAAIERHCLDDVRVTAAIYARIAPVFLEEDA
jgi:hypothetical protein